MLTHITFYKMIYYIIPNGNISVSRHCNGLNKSFKKAKNNDCIHIVKKEVGSQKINNDWVHADPPAHPWKYIFFAEPTQPKKYYFNTVKSPPRQAAPPDRLWHFQAQEINMQTKYRYKIFGSGGCRKETFCSLAANK